MFDYLHFSHVPALLVIYVLLDFIVTLLGIACILFVVPPQKLPPALQSVDAFGPLICAVLLGGFRLRFLIMGLALIVHMHMGIGAILLMAHMLLRIVAFFGVLMMASPAAYEEAMAMFRRSRRAAPPRGGGYPAAGRWLSSARGGGYPPQAVAVIRRPVAVATRSRAAGSNAPREWPVARRWRFGVARVRAADDARSGDFGYRPPLCFAHARTGPRVQSRPADPGLERDPARRSSSCSATSRCARASRSTSTTTTSAACRPGAPVKVSGIKVGKVEDVEFLGGKQDPKVGGKRVQVRVKAWVEDRVRDSIRSDAEFFINTAGVLGEQYLEIVPGQDWDHPPIAANAIIHGAPAVHDPPRTDLVVARLYEVLDGVASVLRDDKDAIKHLLSNSANAVAEANQLLVDNRAQLGELIANGADLAKEAKTTLAKVNAGLGDGRPVANLVADADSTLEGGADDDVDADADRRRR